MSEIEQTVRTRLRGLGLPVVQARTFHAAALRQLLENALANLEQPAR